MALRLLALVLLVPYTTSWSSHDRADPFEKMIPRMMARLDEVRKVLIPLSDDAIKEAQYNAGSYIIPLDAESELCRNHSNHLFDAYLNNQLWALKMVDAASKPPAGMLEGHMMDLGAYDECVGVHEPSGMFVGQHCIVETKGVLPDDVEAFNPERPFLPTLRIDVVFSVCVPSSCSHRDVQVHMDVALNSVNATAIMQPDSCTNTLPQPLSVMDWFTIILILLILLLVFLSTWYDSRCIESEKNELLTSFSLSYNIPRLLSTSITPAALPCLNGLRILAICWVIVGHRMLILLSFPNLRFKQVAEHIDDVALAPLENAQLAVEVFFLLSGTLITYSYLRYKLKGHKFNLPYFYLYRYFRLTPALAMMVLIYATIAIRLGDGPAWKRAFGFVADYCTRNWWATLLYVNNYYNPYEMCITQTWFVSADFQMYFFSPLLLLPLQRRPRLGLTLIAVVFVLTTLFATWNAYYYELHAGGAVAMGRKTEVNQIKDYVVTHQRAGAFLIGLVLGYILFRVKQGELIIKLSRATRWAGWLLSVFMILFSVLFVNVFQDPDYVYKPWLDTLYLVFHRHMLTLGIAWIILVCTLGYGGVVDKFLSWGVFLPLARLTYGAFLTHVLIQNLQNYSLRAPLMLTWLGLWHNMCADTVMSYLAATVLYLTVEAPCTNIITWVFKGKNRSEDLPQTAQNSSSTTSHMPVFKYTNS